MFIIIPKSLMQYKCFKELVYLKLFTWCRSAILIDKIITFITEMLQTLKIKELYMWLH